MSVPQEEPKSPGGLCQHENFIADVAVGRITSEEGPMRFSADVKIRCTECGLPFRFIGLPAGLDLNGAATSIDATEARLAIAPKGDVVSVLDGAPSGFSVRKGPGDPAAEAIMLRERINELCDEVFGLREAIATHHSQKADDRCVEDDDRLYAAAGLPPCDRRVGDKVAMLENCKRFIERRCEGGEWPSYVELEAEIVRLKAARRDNETPLSEQWIKEHGDDGMFIAWDQEVEGDCIGLTVRPWESTNGDWMVCLRDGPIKNEVIIPRMFRTVGEFMLLLELLGVEP